MTYELSESTESAETIEKLHNELATKHGRSDVLVMESSDGDIVAMIGEGAGSIELDGVRAYTQQCAAEETEVNSVESSETVPTVMATEPVYPDLDANTPRWVTCKIQWDPDDEVFVNKQADEDWEVAEEQLDSASYHLGESGEEFSCLSDAMHAALEEAGHEIAEPKLVIRPSETETPEWGGHA